MFKFAALLLVVSPTLFSAERSYKLVSGNHRYKHANVSFQGKAIQTLDLAPRKNAAAREHAVLDSCATIVSKTVCTNFDSSKEAEAEVKGNDLILTMDAKQLKYRAQ